MSSIVFKRKDIDEKIKSLQAETEMWQWVLLLMDNNNSITYKDVDFNWRVEGIEDKRIKLIESLKLTITIYQTYGLYGKYDKKIKRKFKNGVEVFE